ncbi:hypothetical protein SAMN06295912_10763 [Sphingomonas laterariae]|uniref:Uncharacterized protein n=1 Tax=Edaphosphingomonas laterariae TaxID=861865 RepID=A0A239ERN4_9SPHN|nr:hypothetical protein [Sphingomonas laterariae]SNS47081.1 hypothetical protein SAMN06295912_10763 [Sphingomonas laterariae]
MTNHIFLRRILAIDAVSCLGMGAMLVLAAPALAGPFGLEAILLRGAGLLLLPLGLFIGWLASRAVPPAALVWIVILGNLGWGLESLLLIGQAKGTITAPGAGFVAAQGLFVLAMAALEYRGVRQIRQAN